MSSSPLSEQFPNVEIRPHSRSRRLKLSYTPKRGFLLTHPPRASRRSIEVFLNSQIEWMQKVQTDAKIRTPNTSLIDHLKDHPTLSLNGTPKTICFTPISGLLQETRDSILIYPEITETQLLRKLQQLAKQPLTNQLLTLASHVKLEVNKIQIRDQKSRWGSCSGRGTISLNWRIILMPHKLQNHILLHELAHIPHPDHSENFWNCLRNWDTDTEHHRAQIRRHGSLWISLGR